ncbi:MAG: hypothetical protein RBU29_12665, partial [bacterium]|nr:hypothetical protein [bacterium]
MRIPYLSNPNEILPPSPGKPDRVSQTLFGKFGDEKRWEALDAIAVAGQSEWNQRLLLWMLANENAEMRDRCWEILDRLPLHFDLLVRELSCPMWQVRVGVMRLLVKSGRLDLIRLLIAGLEDYHPHVVEETKRSLGKLIENAQARKQRGDLPAAEVRYALEALMQPLYLSRRSPRFQAVPFLFPVALLEEDHFWSLYTELDLPQYTLLHEEFVRAQHEDALRVMYRGLLRPNEAILDRLSPFIATTVRNHRDGINQHLHVIRGFAREAFVQLAFVLQHYRILVEYQGMIKHLNPPERIVLFDLLEVVGAEQNLSFLLRCLQLDDTRIKIRVLKILGESEQLSLRHEVFEFLTDADE